MDNDLNEQLQGQEDNPNLIINNQPNQNENNEFNNNYPEEYQNQAPPPQYFNNIPQQPINNENQNIVVDLPNPNEIDNNQFNNEVNNQPIYNKPEQISETNYINNVNQIKPVIPQPYTNLENNEPIVCNQNINIQVPFSNEPYTNNQMNNQNYYYQQQQNQYQYQNVQPYRKKDQCAEFCCACGIGCGVFCCVSIILYGIICYVIVHSIFSAIENIDNNHR